MAIQRMPLFTCPGMMDAIAKGDGNEAVRQTFLVLAG
jgi:hypothetical protein